MQEIRSSNPPVVTRICDPNKSRARHHRNFYIFRIFDRYISNVVSKNIFVCLFIYFNIIWTKICYIDNNIEKVVRVDFYAYIFEFITHF